MIVIILSLFSELEFQTYEQYYKKRKNRTDTQIKFYKVVASCNYSMAEKHG